jgi:hypothetical protein
MINKLNVLPAETVVVACFILVLVAIVVVDVLVSPTIVVEQLTEYKYKKVRIIFRNTFLRNINIVTK